MRLNILIPFMLNWSRTQKKISFILSPLNTTKIPTADYNHYYHMACQLISALSRRNRFCIFYNLLPDIHINFKTNLIIGQWNMLKLLWCISSQYHFLTTFLMHGNSPTTRASFPWHMNLILIRMFVCVQNSSSHTDSHVLKVVLWSNHSLVYAW